MYVAAVNNLNVAPSEFWQMTPTELSVLFKDKAKQNSGSKLSAADSERLEQRRAELEAQGVEVW